MKRTISRPGASLTRLDQVRFGVARRKTSPLHVIIPTVMARIPPAFGSWTDLLTPFSALSEDRKDNIFIERKQSVTQPPTVCIFADHGPLYVLSQAWSTSKPSSIRKRRRGQLKGQCEGSSHPSPPIQKGQLIVLQRPGPLSQWTLLKDPLDFYSSSFDTGELFKLIYNCM